MTLTTVSCYNGTSFATIAPVSSKNGSPCTGCYTVCLPSSLVGINNTALTSVALCLINGNVQPPGASVPGVYCNTSLCNSQNACLNVPPVAPYPSPPTSPSGSKETSAGLGAGAIAGIVVGTIAAVVVLVAAAIVALRRRRSRVRAMEKRGPFAGVHVSVGKALQL